VPSLPKVWRTRTGGKRETRKKKKWERVGSKEKRARGTRNRCKGIKSPSQGLKDHVPTEEEIGRINEGKKTPNAATSRKIAEGGK